MSPARPSRTPSPGTSTPSSVRVPVNELLDPMKSATKVLAGCWYRSTGVSTCWTRPSCITAMRSAIDMASSWSWVTTTKVMPTSCCSRFSSSCISARTLRSSADSGSSSRSSRGRLTMARARATRCRWPPESWAGRAFVFPVSPTVASTSSTRLRTSALGSPSRSSPYATFLATDMWGNSA